MKNLAIIVVFILLPLRGVLDNNIVSEENTIVSNESTELEVYDFKGIQKFLSTKGDKTYVVNFWATWCAPCVKELPYFEEINTNYSKDNVEVILISLDFPKHYDTKLKPFIEKHQLKSKVIALNDPDSNTWIPKVDESWSGALPATIIFNKNKKEFYEQSFNYQELETQLKQFLN